MSETKRTNWRACLGDCLPVCIVVLVSAGFAYVALGAFVAFTIARAQQQ
jgi:hypothetical protein